MRTFVAIEVNNKEVLNSIEEFQAGFKVKAKPVSLQSIHFTLLFLGEISEEILEKIKIALNSIEFSSFEVSFSGIGAFPKAKFPRVIWVGTDEKGGNLLVDIAQKVQGKLLPLGFKADKKFQPHVTIFRVKNKIGDISDELSKFNKISFGKQVVSEIKLKKSELTPQGPIYSDLQVVRSQ